MLAETLLEKSSPKANMALVNGVSSTQARIREACDLKDAPEIRVIGPGKATAASGATKHVPLPASLRDILA